MKQILNKLFDYQSLTRSEATEVMTNIAEGKYNDAQLAAFISVFLMRSIALDEIVGFRDALLQMAVRAEKTAFDPIDIVGTGGDGKNTFNISTCACFVVAGAGYKVAKHGNYGATSISGASNVLEFYGAKHTTDMASINRSLEKSGFAYLHAPLWNPAMKNVGNVRKNLGVRTFFNILGPLINPIQPNFQLLGVYNLKMMRLYNYFYQNSGINYTVVHTLDGYDEVSLSADCKVCTPRGEQMYKPEELGFERIAQEALSGGASVADAARIFGEVLSNQSTDAQRNAVVINAAFAIRTLCPEKTVETCVAEAREAIENGSAKRAFAAYLSLSAK